MALEDIGENDTALLCKTNFTSFCMHDFTGTGSILGNWFFPNGTTVLSSDKQWDFYRTAGQNVVKMNRRRGGVEGIYRCEICDSMNVTQIVHIGVYITGECLYTSAGDIVCTLMFYSTIVILQC